MKAIAVYNRPDGFLADRIDGFTLEVLDNNRKIVYEKKALQAPKGKEDYPIGVDSAENRIRRAAMLALTSVRGQEEHTFVLLAKIIRTSADRHAAVKALLQIPTDQWPAKQA